MKRSISVISAILRSLTKAVHWLITQDKNLTHATILEKKLNKCYQCTYESSQAANLRQRMKIDTGQNSNKCTQCEYICSHPKSLSRHLKTHADKKSCHEIFHCDCAFTKSDNHFCSSSCAFSLHLKSDNSRLDSKLSTFSLKIQGVKT